MKYEVIDQKVEAYNIAFNQRLAELKTDEEKQQFIEGAVFALDALYRYGSLKDLSPVGREIFIGSLANSYSTAFHQKLDPDKYIKDLIKSRSTQTAEAFVSAAKVQQESGVPLTFEEEARIRQMTMLAQFVEKMKKD
ncbi:MAG: hypothetical protein WC842_03215 [Candidatus Paceibacterota bacterium]|jgi:hypothetical protein